MVVFVFVVEDELLLELEELVETEEVVEELLEDELDEVVVKVTSASDPWKANSDILGDFGYRDCSGTCLAY